MAVAAVAIRRGEMLLMLPFPADDGLFVLETSSAVDDIVACSSSGHNKDKGFIVARFLQQLLSSVSLITDLK